MTDEELYQLATDELLSDKRRTHIWARACALASDDHDEARYLYTNLRAEELIAERDAYASVDASSPSSSSTHTNVIDKPQADTSFATVAQTSSHLDIGTDDSMLDTDQTAESARFLEQALDTNVEARSPMTQALSEASNTKEPEEALSEDFFDDTIDLTSELDGTAVFELNRNDATDLGDYEFDIEDSEEPARFTPRQTHAQTSEDELNDLLTDVYPAKAPSSKKAIFEESEEAAMTVEFNDVTGTYDVLDEDVSSLVSEDRHQQRVSLHENRKSIVSDLSDESSESELARRTARQADELSLDALSLGTDISDVEQPLAAEETPPAVDHAFDDAAAETADSLVAFTDQASASASSDYSLESDYYGREETSYPEEQLQFSGSNSDAPEEDLLYPREHSGDFEENADYADNNALDTEEETFYTKEEPDYSEEHLFNETLSSTPESEAMDALATKVEQEFAFSLDTDDEHLDLGTLDPESARTASETTASLDTNQDLINLGDDTESHSVATAAAVAAGTAAIGGAAAASATTDTTATRPPRRRHRASRVQRRPSLPIDLSVHQESSKDPCYEVFRRDAQAQAVKSGVSWPALFLTLPYLLYRQLFGTAIAYTVLWMIVLVGLVTCGLAWYQAGPSASLVIKGSTVGFSVLALIGMIYLPFRYANQWRQERLVQRGFERVARVRASSPHEAITQARRAAALD